jgi:hypothetical protein
MHSSGMSADSQSYARLTVLEPAQNGAVVVSPWDTNYQLHLVVAPGDTPVAPAGALILAQIVVRARKLWTVPSGGSFISPIVGPPRIVQGRVRAAHGRRLIVQAGAPICVDLPDDQDVFDLASGPISMGGLVNVTCEPHATLIPVPVAAASQESVS